MNTIEELKTLIMKGYEVVDTTEYPEDNYVIIELSYLQTPYQVDVPEDKDLTLNLRDWNQVLNSTWFDPS